MGNSLSDGWVQSGVMMMRRTEGDLIGVCRGWAMMMDVDRGEGNALYL